INDDGATFPERDLPKRGIAYFTHAVIDQVLRFVELGRLDELTPAKDGLGVALLLMARIFAPVVNIRDRHHQTLKMKSRIRLVPAERNCGRNQERWRRSPAAIRSPSSRRSEE